MHPQLRRLPAFALLAAALLAGPAAAKPRNLVFILADDLGWGDLGCYGQEKIRTPHIDRLAAEGTRFTRHYSGAPVCAPARCVLLTGKHLGHAEIRGNRQAKRSFPEFNEGQHPISAGALTLAEVFHDAGFATGAMGKWGLGPVGSTGDPNVQGLDLFFGYNCQAVAHSFYPRYLWRNNQRVGINKHPIPGHANQLEGEVKMTDWIGETYASHPIRDEALAFIRRHKDRPFFLYLPFTEPHVAMHPPVEAVNGYPADWDDRPYRGQCGYLPHPRPRAGYAAMISELDRHVGAVTGELRQAGILDQTLVVFTSDNGTIPAGATNNTPSYFADWFPTLCAAFELEPPSHPDGEDLWPVLTGRNTLDSRKPMVWVYPEYGGQVAVRFGDMKVVRQELASNKPKPWELYHLAKDPGETTNLAAEHPDLIQQAITILKREVSPNPLFPLTIPGP